MVFFKCLPNQLFVGRKDKENVDFEKLCDFAKEAAFVSTNKKLTTLNFAKNHNGQPDVAMFDFTSLFQAENSSRIVERNNKKLFMSLVGDSLLEVRYFFFKKLKNLSQLL